MILEGEGLEMTTLGTESTFPAKEIYSRIVDDAYGKSTGLCR